MRAKGGGTARHGPGSVRQIYYDQIGRQQLAPLWERLGAMVPSEPRPNAVPFHWPYARIRPYLLEAGALISAEEAERRVLVLENPGLPGQSRITDTLYSGLQLILPGEVAPAHRHTQSALRLVLEGEGGYTSVDGERTMMHPGDFIITPAWTWHDHGNQGDDPVIWLDGLDVPLVGFLGAGFREEHGAASHAITRATGDSDARYGANMLPIGMAARRTSPIFNYPYDRSREALFKLAAQGDIDPRLGICLRHVNPTNGDWAIPTIATALRLLPKGYRGLPYRTIEGTAFILLEGRARLVVGDSSFQLDRADAAAVPGWTPFSLEADEDSVLFSFSDRPVYEKLGLWREERL